MRESIGFRDGKGTDICCNDIVKTYDSKGRKWVGRIVPVDPGCIALHPFLEIGRTLYEFSPPHSYPTWINDQEYASKLEVLKGADSVPIQDLMVQKMRRR